MTNAHRDFLFQRKIFQLAHLLWIQTGDIELTVSRLGRTDIVGIGDVLILLIDYIAINVAYVVSLMSVTNVSIELLDIEYLTFIIRVTPFYAVFTIAVYYIFRLYIDDYKKICDEENKQMIWDEIDRENQEVK